MPAKALSRHFSGFENSTYTNRCQAATLKSRDSAFIHIRIKVNTSASGTSQAHHADLVNLLKSDCHMIRMSVFGIQYHTLSPTLPAFIYSCNEI